MSFVTTDGTALSLDGQPFRMAGANNYYLPFAPDSAVDAVFDLASQLGLNTLRTWAFLDCGPAGLGGPAPANTKGGVYFHYWNTDARRPDFNDGPDGLERLDRVIALAEQHSIRLILPLANYWPDFGGVDQYLQWFGLSGREQFYLHPDVKQAYRDYAAHLLLRVNTKTGRQYRDEPAILAWELMNEPRYVDADGSRLPGGTDTLLGWADEMSAYLRSLDPNHLIGVGDEGYFHRDWSFGHPPYNGSFGVDCERILDLPSIDFGTCHLYPEFSPKEDPVDFGLRWIREHIEAGQRANKPMLIEEYGLKIEAGLEARNAAFAKWLDEVDANHGAGAAVWMIASTMPDGSLYPDYDHYTVYSAKDVPAITAFARGESS